MNCDKCGAKLRDDQVFCPECGAEIQLVANYNPTEEELMGLDMNIVAPDISGLDDPDIDKSGKKSLTPAARRVLGIVFAILIIFIIGFVVTLFLANDYGHQYDEAQKAYDSGDFKAAIDRANRAISIDDRNIDVMWLLARSYTRSGEYDNALDTVKKILSLTSNDADVYDNAMALFIDVKDYKSAAALLDTTTDVNIREKYSMYLAAVPTANIGGGDLTYEPSVELGTEGKSKIYYTLDKGDASTGTVYSGPIKITAGRHTLRAVSVNQFGVISEERVIEYNVTPGIPDMPEILPAGVNIPMGTEITINVPEDCHVYYTWDGSEPTVNSYEYKEPMQAPEGNNILSVIVVDKYGQSSNVAKKNYIVN